MEPGCKVLNVCPSAVWSWQERGPLGSSIHLESGAGTSLVVQWLRHHPSTARGSGSIPGQGRKVPHAIWCSQNIQKRKNKPRWGWEPLNVVWIGKGCQWEAMCGVPAGASDYSSNSNWGSAISADHTCLTDGKRPPSVSPPHPLCSHLLSLS